MGIKQKREHAGMTQVELARQLGVDQSTVCLWETRKTMPRAGLLPKLAKLLNCTIDDLLSDTQEQDLNYHRSPIISENVSNKTD